MDLGTEKENIPSAFYSYREKQVKKEMHRGGKDGQTWKMLLGPAGP